MVLKDNVTPLSSGKYPEIRTENVPGGACEGEYSVVCTVRDDSGSGLGFYDFKVKAGMGISGSVKHFAAWEEKRLEYNVKNPDTPRSSSTFWPQEAFELNASVKGNPTSVKVSLKEYKGEKVKLVKSGSADDGLLVYKGSYFDNKIAEKLAAEGRTTLTFIFEASYSDGKTASDEVTVIIDNAGGSDMQLHRVW